MFASWKLILIQMPRPVQNSLYKIFVVLIAKKLLSPRGLCLVQMHVEQNSDLFVFCLFFRLLINSRDIVAHLRPGWSSLISVLSSWGLNQETTHTTMRHRLLKMVEDYKWHTLLQLLCHFWSYQRINAQRSAWQPLPSNQEKRESLLHPVPFPSLYSHLFLSTMSLFNPQSSFAFLFNVPHLLLSVMLHIGLFLWVSSFLKCTSPLLTLFSSLLPSPLSLSSLFWLSLSPSDAVCWANESQGN